MKPKPTSAPKENFNKFDRLIQRERSINLLSREFDYLADFYGFSKIHPSALDSHRFFMPLVKAGFLEERQLAVCKTKNGDPFMLRTSAILSVMRVYLANKLSDLPHPLKIFANTESFQFNKAKDGGGVTVTPEFGIVMFEEVGAVATAEIFQVLWRALQELGFPADKAEIRLNTLGCQECKPIYRSTLAAYLRSRLGRLCKNCKNLKNNPYHCFSCQEEKCKIVANNAPPILDFLCEACKKYLKEVLEFLDELGMPYLLDAKFFKQKSWHSKITWEMQGLGAEKQLLAEGGGMSSLFETLGGNKQVDVCGGTVFLENLEKFIFQEKITLKKISGKPKIFLTQLGELAKRKSFSLLEELRKAEIEVAESLSKDAIKSQLKAAETMGAEIALILGQKEALDKTVIVRDLQSGIQETIPQEKLIEFLKKKQEITTN